MAIRRLSKELLSNKKGLKNKPQKSLKDEEKNGDFVPYPISKEILEGKEKLHFK